MSKSGVFSRDFQRAVAGLLKDRCTASGRTTRVEVAALLGDQFGVGDKTLLANLVSLAVTTGAVGGFETRLGRSGGIVPAGTPKAADRPKEPKKRKAKVATPEVAEVAEVEPVEAVAVEAVVVAAE